MMPKYVTQEEVFQILTELNDPFGAKVRTTEAMRRISAIPAADVVEVRYGRWIHEPGHIPHCSECGRYSDDADTGEAICCPFCGASMQDVELDGGQDE